MRRPRWRSAWATAIVLSSLAVSSEAHAGSEALRVCADPNHLPYSNEAGEGFENRLAVRVAAVLGRSLETTWWPQRRGFLRNTLEAGRCDVVMGVPTEMDRLATTRPYYHSCYAWVSRPEGPVFASLDAPDLRHRRIGVHLIGDDYQNSPPAHALAERGIVEGVVGYSVYGDYGKPSPLRAPVDAVVAGEIDAALIWGPIAGFFARKAVRPLRVTPLPEGRDTPFGYTIAMGVRHGDSGLLKDLESALTELAPEIEGLLAEYGVPRCAETDGGLHRVTDTEPTGEAAPATSGNPVAGNPDAIAAGAKLFKKLNCSACHGAAGGGGMGPDLTDEEWKTGNGDDASLLVQVLEGRAAMPPYKSVIGEDEAWQLIAFIRTLYRGDLAKKTW